MEGTLTKKKVFWSNKYIDPDAGKKGCWVISKEIEKNNEGVENGATKLLNEASHIIRANKSNTPIKGLYAHCFGFEQKKNKIYAYFKFYWDGQTMGDLLRNIKIDFNTYERAEQFLFKILFRNFYKNRKIPVADDYWEKMFFDRIARRIKVTKHLISGDPTIKVEFNVLKKSIENGFYLNDKFYSPIQKYLDILRTNKKFIKSINPAYAQETHQDLNVNDVVVHFSRPSNKITEFKLIDPRGNNETGPRYRHFYYDAGKWMFVNDGLDIYRLHNKELFKRYGESLTLNYSEDSIIPRFYFRINENHPIVNRYKKARSRFISMLESLTEFAWFKQDHPNWVKAINLSEACMYIPDVPCRIITDSHNNPKIAIAAYLRGVELLDRFINAYMQKSDT